MDHANVEVREKAYLFFADRVAPCRIATVSPK